MDEKHEVKKPYKGETPPSFHNSSDFEWYHACEAWEEYHNQEIAKKDAEIKELKENLNEQANDWGETCERAFELKKENEELKERIKKHLIVDALSNGKIERFEKVKIIKQ